MTPRSSQWLSQALRTGATRPCRRVTAMVFGAALLACTPRVRVPAPTEAHRPEPVAPVLTPAPVPSARERLVQLADSARNAPMWRPARWGMLVVDATTGDTLLARDADKLFMPASNQKLLTSAIALQVLGPDYRWRTPVLLRGTQQGQVFRGDLVIIGTGDPSVSDSIRAGGAASAFDPIVSALAARGITRIEGGVVAAGDAFAGATTGYGWEADDFDADYSAPIDELLFNEGLLRVHVRGTTAGAPAVVMTAPTASYPTVQSTVRTRAATDTGARLRIAHDSTVSTVAVTGTIAAGDSAVLTTAYRHPNDAFRAALTERLAAAGVTIVAPPPPTQAKPASRRARRGRLAVQEVPAAPASVPEDTLVTLVSPTLLEVLPRLQKPSQNQIAEMLFRSAGRVGSGSGQADSARAVGARALAALGVMPEHIAYRDGSGLSRHDYLTPRAVVRVLDAMHRAPWSAAYRAALPLAGVDGTIRNRMKNTPAAGNANAKTGTLDKARSLSGYVTTADGHLVLFSLLCNSFTVPTREVERVQDQLVTFLAGARLGGS